jgi:tetratricopeptide (TPR) repeat protein
MNKTCLLGVLIVSMSGAQDRAPTAREIEAMAATLTADLRGNQEIAQPGPASSQTLERPAGGAVSAAQLRYKPKKNAQKSVAKGVKFAQEGLHQEAAEEFEKAIADDPQFSAAYDRLGVEYGQLGRYGEAQAELQRSVAFDPGSWVGHFDLGVLLYKTGDLAGAERSVRRALELSNANVQVHTLLGVLLWRSVETRAEGLEHLRYAARSNSEAKELLASLEGK